MPSPSSEPQAIILPRNVRRAFLGTLCAAAALVLAAGCGTGGKATSSGDQNNGKKLFTEKCAGCHTLAAAGAKGTVGPSLDDAFAGPKREHFKQTTIQNVVLDQIREASAPMPANLVKGQDAIDVAGYVAAVAATNAKPPAQTSTDGKSIFSANCASCHTLSAAGATGTIGPNLDQLKPSFPIAQHQVEVGGGVMPAFKGTLSQAQIDAVAKYVADNAGK
jgi:cbb3-type cytochrome c oxidase subunit III